MSMPENAVTLTPEQIHDLSEKLSVTRHDINNHLSLIIAATELIKRKPDSIARMTENIAQQPDKIMKEMRAFSDAFEQALGITKD